MPVYETSLERECSVCEADAAYIKVSDEEGERAMPTFLCAMCAIGQTCPPEQEPEVVWTVSTEYQDMRAAGKVCTRIDGSDKGYCGGPATVFVLKNGWWEYDCLCSEHLAGMSPESLHHEMREHDRSRR